MTGEVMATRLLESMTYGVYVYLLMRIYLEGVNP